MHFKNLGASNLKVSQIGLGCMGMSEFYGATDEVESTNTLLKAIELGVNFFDTADMYGSGENEKLIGKVLKPFRDKIVLGTKFGFVRDPNDPNARLINAKPDYVKQACEESLKRLGVNYIDLYYLHRVDATVPIEDTVGAMAELVKQGKVKHLGLSEVSVKNLKKAHKVHPISAVQSEYSLWCREPETEIIPLCKELNITFVPYSPLGRGFLTNKIISAESLEKDDFRRAMPRFHSENFQKNLDLVVELSKIAAAKNCSPAQLALAWVMAQADNIVPIPGTKRCKYLVENIGACDIELLEGDIQLINDLFKSETIFGERYNSRGMELIDKK